LKWGPRERAGEDDDNVVLGSSSGGAGARGGMSSSRIGSDASGHQHQQLVRHNRIARSSRGTQRSDLDSGRSDRSGRSSRDGGRLTPHGSDEEEEEGEGASHRRHGDVNDDGDDLGQFVGDDVTDSASAVSPLDGATINPPISDTIDPIGNNDYDCNGNMRGGENDTTLDVIDPISNNGNYNANSGDDFSFVSGVSGGVSGSGESGSGERAPSPWDGMAGEGTEFIDPISGKKSTGEGGSSFLAFLGDGSDESSGSTTTAPPLQLYSNNNNNSNGDTSAGNGADGGGESHFGVGLLDFTKGTLSNSYDNNSGRHSSRREGMSKEKNNSAMVVVAAGSASGLSRVASSRLGEGYYEEDGGEDGEWKYAGLGDEDPDRPWKGVEALAKWLTAVLAYHEASEVHNALKERELADRER